MSKLNKTPLMTPPKLDDPSLISTWSHRAWMTIGCTTVLASLAASLVGSINSKTWLTPILSGFAGYIVADLVTGVYHWGVDNYGNTSTPVFGPQIDAFQGHHRWPWMLPRHQFAKNSYQLARVITFIVLPVNLVWHDRPVVMCFVGMAGGCIMFCQQFHAWAHGTKSKLPRLVVALQDCGVLLARSQHADHHRRLYGNNYCIVSGVWNRFLDENKVFEALDMVVFIKLGLRPRSWSKKNSDWMEAAVDSPVIDPLI